MFELWVKLFLAEKNIKNVETPLQINRGKVVNFCRQMSAQTKAVLNLILTFRAIVIELQLLSLWKFLKIFIYFLIKKRLEVQNNFNLLFKSF